MDVEVFERGKLLVLFGLGDENGFVWEGGSESGRRRSSSSTPRRGLGLGPVAHEDVPELDWAVRRRRPSVRAQLRSWEPVRGMLPSTMARLSAVNGRPLESAAESRAVVKRPGSRRRPRRICICARTMSPTASISSPLVGRWETASAWRSSISLSSSSRTTAKVEPAKPCWIAFGAERALPSGVRGPVEVARWHDSGRGAFRCRRSYLGPWSRSQGIGYESFGDAFLRFWGEQEGEGKTAVGSLAG